MRSGKAEPKTRSISNYGGEINRRIVFAEAIPCLYYLCEKILETGCTVLIVDDDPSHLKIYKWVLERGGFRPLPALVKRGLVDLSRGEHVDVAVVDYRLGAGLSAVDVAKGIRELYPSTPILVLSDLFGMPEDIAPYAAAFVRKGEPQQLLDTIRETIKAAA
jgi:DNA-binding NtrC family response regulator